MRSKNETIGQRLRRRRQVQVEETESRQRESRQIIFSQSRGIANESRTRNRRKSEQFRLVQRPTQVTQFHVVPNQRDENMQIEAAESENLGAIMETDSDGNRNNRNVLQNRQLAVYESEDLGATMDTDTDENQNRHISRHEDRDLNGRFRRRRNSQQRNAATVRRDQRAARNARNNMM